MAANSNGFIRVRLFFDYPPPAASDCRMCWLLVDLNACRVVADLESVIREKFDFSSRSILNLFIDDCYLPHTERILLVRDNDSVRVKVDTVAQVNGHSSCQDTASKHCRKRPRPAEDDGPVGNEVSVERKEKKRKKKSKESLELEAKQASGDESKKSQGKDEEKKKKKKKKKKAEVKSSPVATPKPATPAKKNSSGVDQPVKSAKKPPAAPAKTQSKKPHDPSSDSSISSSDEDEAPKKPTVPKPAPKTPLSTPAASKAPPAAKPPPKKTRISSPSSSDTDSSSDEAPSVKVPAKHKPLTSKAPKSTVMDNLKNQQAPSAPQSTNCAQKQAASTALPPGGKVVDSDSEEEIKLIIRKPMLQQQQQPHRGRGVGGRGVGAQSSWRGGSQGGLGRGDRGERGRGEGGGVLRGHPGSLEFNCNGAKEPSYQTDSLSNKSVVVQNREEPAPRQDYSTMPLLAAPPQAGQKIAFKLLELAENYTPEVSEYKEGRIVSFDPTTKQIELELFHVSQASVEPGKFDLVYQNADGSESVEYAVSRGAWVTERWDSLLEPRLVI